MIRPLLLCAVALACSAPAFARSEDDSTYIRLARAMETFGSVFREINSRYVDEIDPKELVDVGVGAMLEYLDPYSEYFEDDETDEVEQITTGSYVGFGITVGSIDSLLTITDVRDSGPARAAGIRIGDHLLSIDSTRTDTLRSRELRPYTRGAAGTSARMRLLREGRSDTLDLVVKRSELELESVALKDVLAGDIAYINLVRFSRNTSSELRTAIADLRSRKQLKGLILDLRDNPGGLLEAAIDVVEFFVPTGSKIVSTRGRDEESFTEYSSEAEPIEPSLPLVVLINEQSASASEIVAGALQDLDRAVIIGSRSFGKGLVQSIIPLSDQALLKLTTARYYTPSGRCIQRLSYRSDSTITDTIQYRTSSGRRVSATHGIDPDSTVADSMFSKTVQHLLAGNLIQRYATRATALLKELPAGFSSGRETFEGFVKFVEEQPTQKRSPLLSEISSAIDRATRDRWPASTIAALEAGRKAVEKDLVQNLRREQSQILMLIDIEMRTRFGTVLERDRRLLAVSPAVKAATDILSSSRHRQFLTGELPANH
ncbi:MAG: S41 family peptidase [Candidatus Kapabacteria bacterium]|nr:S41 family peptidase [Candidatus Kapabacteria bacterium]